MIKKIAFVVIKIRNIINTIIFRLSYAFCKNIRLNAGFRINRWPLIKVHKKALLVISDGVLLNSSNYTYHINMHSKVKIMCDVEGAQINIGKNTRIHGTCIHAFKRIDIGQDCLIAANCQIFDSNGHNSLPNERRTNNGEAKEIKIGDNVWIGANVTILPGVKIERNAVIGANSLVLKDVYHNTVVVGIPAKEINKRKKS